VQDQQLADRFATYSDAMAAAAFVAFSALSLALGDPDVRCQIGRSPFGINLANVLFGVAMSGGLWTLRRWELDLRAEEESSEKATRYEKRLSQIRHFVVWLSVLAAIGLVALASSDKVCAAMPGVAA